MWRKTRLTLEVHGHVTDLNGCLLTDRGPHFKRAVRVIELILWCTRTQGGHRGLGFHAKIGI